MQAKGVQLEIYQNHSWFLVFIEIGKLLLEEIKLVKTIFFSRQNIFLFYLLGSFIVQSMKSWHQHSKQIGQNQITRKETKKNICKYFFHYSFKNGDCFQCVYLFIFKLLCLTFCSLISFLKNALEGHKTKSNISFLFRK